MRLWSGEAGALAKKTKESRHISHIYSSLKHVHNWATVINWIDEIWHHSNVLYAAMYYSIHCFCCWCNVWFCNEAKRLSSTRGSNKLKQKQSANSNILNVQVSITHVRRILLMIEVKGYMVNIEWEHIFEHAQNVYLLIDMNRSINSMAIHCDD